ncbi:hypothetical protein EMIHUDRAFT_106604 [Emiliania huxleyi CCMP1516]|uniref:Uncharacterized protein n=2 Tax=Emiliania huxleyi TaxID=2903 RepID=A0A0D3I6M2_EMIH1|nr:hypothetical protein EMIHUDRAFT_106604 [Emiliania huxleyi CCMP1516]EOD06907.1 hypothetical protein EMIHUDRAFT_106604 [Emiliania huxleyi CCMP1516]|eukprot:XP_005759336.1 hypothetical protein EMIHUDRAFT_106604 [Emiliania huxleyi CCMP1516]
MGGAPWVAVGNRTPWAGELSGAFFFSKLKEEHGKITAKWKEWDATTKAEYFDLVGGTMGRPPDVEVEPWDEPDEGEKLRASARPPEPATRVALSRFRPHTLLPAKELLSLAEFTSKHEFLHQAQQRFTTVVHNRNWRDLAMELAEEGSAGSRSAPRGKRGKARAEGRERARHAAWREAARFVAVSQDGAGAFLSAIPMRDDMRMETWAMRISLQQTTRRGRVLGTGGKRYSGDVKVVCRLTSSGEHGRKGAFVAFGNTEAFYRNMVVGHGPYCEEGEGGRRHVQLLLFESFGGFGKGVGEILWKAAKVLQNKLTRAQCLDEVTWTTKSWLGLQKQRISSRSSHGHRRADCE